MLKRRIAAAIIIKDGLAVQSIGFKKYLPIGKPPIAVEFLNKWGIDEIVMIDISASSEKRSIDPLLVKETSLKCFVPLAAGGGIKNMNEVDALMHSGADKVVLNQVIFNDPDFVTAVARKYGDQSVIVCIDIKKGDDQQYYVYDHVKKEITKNTLKSFIVKAEALGAGEIMIHSVDRDGSYEGFDIDAYKIACNIATVPVIALGGAGNPIHFFELLKNTSVSAACAGNYFHFNEHSVIITKSVLKNNGINLRLETHADYSDASIDDKNRLLKKSDKFLEDLLYIKIEKEII